MSATLRLVEGFEPGKRFDLSAPCSVIGRSGDCEVSLDVAAVSRRHAQVLNDGQSYRVEDLGSRNGTYVNGARIVEPTTLKPGDRIAICDQEFVFESRVRPDGPSLLGGGPASANSSLVEMVDDRDAATTDDGLISTTDGGLNDGLSHKRL